MLAGFLAAAGCTQSSTESLWAKSTTAPSRFVVSAKSDDGVDLPANREDFTRYMTGRGASYYVTGEGKASALSAPPPDPSSPCEKTSKVAVYSFALEGKYMPRYVAYLGDDDLIRCVEKQFSYSAI